MKKILTLNGDTFSTGIASGAYSQDTGLWTTAEGITTVSDLFTQSAYSGVLQAGPTPVAMTSPGGKPMCYASRVNSTVKYLYVLDDNGGIYNIDLSGTPSLTSIYASGSGLQDGVVGAFYMKHSNADEYLYFFHGLTTLSQMGPLQTNNNLGATTYTGWQSTKYHVAHQFLDRTYITNGRYIGVVYDDGSGGLTVNKTALDFEQTFEAKSISDDGIYLIAAISTNTYTNNLIRGRTKIIFWDTVSSSWAREWPVEDASVLSIKNTPLGMIAITTRGIMSFSFNEAPKPLTPLLATADVPDFQYPAQYAADTLGSSMAFGGTGSIGVFGKLRPDMKNALSKPFGGFGSDSVTMLATRAHSTYAIAGTSGNDLYYIALNGTATPLTGVSGKTVFIDLKSWYQIGRIVVRFETPLASGDDFSLKVSTKNSDTELSWGSATYTNNGAVQARELYGSITGDHIRLIPSFNGGAVKIKEIEVWGDPVSTPVYA